MHCSLIPAAHSLLCSQTPWSSTKRRPKPLTAEEWKDAFDADGRLLNDGAQVIGRVRRGGVAPEIRFEVWPFLLGVHELDSTESERKKKKLERRRKFAGLRKQAEALSQRIQEETARKEKEEEMAALKREARAEARRGKKSELSADEVAVDIRKGPEGHQDENGVGPESRSNSTDEKEKRHQIDAQQEDPSPAEPLDNLVSITEFGKTEPAQTSGADDLAESKPGPPETPESADEPESSKSQQSSDPRPPEDAQALEEFQTWLRIIRLDAVRMNAAWIPYAPAQAACDPEKAEEMARAVGLENDEHLEPARRAHAARLVAILEAYAVYDKETGYCQGMSDLLSPFVALIESDAEAFWCFQR